MDPYAHPLHMKVVKNTLYMYGMDMGSTWGEFLDVHHWHNDEVHSPAVTLDLLICHKSWQPPMVITTL